MGATRFLFRTIAGGFFILLPVVLLVLVLAEVVGAVSDLSEAIAGLLPVEELGGVELATIVAILLILLVCLLTGLIARTGAGGAIGRWFERTLLERAPGYRLIKSLTTRIWGDAEGSRFAPAFLEGPDGVRDPVFIVDEMKDGDFAVLVPLAPTPTIGTIRIVPGNRLTRMEAGLGPVANSIMQWGLDAGEVLKDPRPD
jgi:uncharacterized membrane protein